MISRLTASAALFAILATAGLGFAADTPSRRAADPSRPRRRRRSRMPTVDVTGKRLRPKLIARPAAPPAGAQGRQSVHFQRRPARDRRLPGKPTVCRGA